jgi:hypothetical protein
MMRIDMTNELSTAAEILGHVRSDAYSAKRMAGIDDQTAEAYRRVRDQLKSYPSAIILPEALVLLPRTNSSGRYGLSISR